MCYESKDAAFAAVCKERDRLSDCLGRANADCKRLEQERDELRKIIKMQACTQNIDKEKLKHLEELVEAENEGRLVVLKCVPALKPYMKNTLYIIDDGEIFDDYVTEIIVGENESGEVVSVYGMYGGDVCTEKDFGKTVFLTEEEAQEALAADTNVGSKCVVDLFGEEGGEILNG